MLSTGHVSSPERRVVGDPISWRLTAPHLLTRTVGLSRTCSVRLLIGYVLKRVAFDGVAETAAIVLEPSAGRPPVCLRISGVQRLEWDPAGSQADLTIHEVLPLVGGEDGAQLLRVKFEDGSALAVTFGGEVVVDAY